MLCCRFGGHFRATRPNTVYSGEGAARAADQAEADGEFSKLGERSSTTASQRRRTFGARSSFRKRVRDLSFLVFFRRRT